MIRRYGEPPRTGKRYKTRPGAYGILADGDDVLVTFQAEPHMEVQLPGGGIDPGEGPIAALHREVFEETGWAIATPRKLGAFRRFAYMPEYDIWAEKICHIYLARPVTRRYEPIEPAHTALWLPAREAIETLGNPGDRAFLSAFVASRT